MQEKEKIWVHQFTLLVIIFIVGSSILVVPSSLTKMAKQDAWIITMIGPCISLLFVWLYHSLAKRFSGMNLIEICEYVLGRWLGTFVSLAFISYFLLLSAGLLLELGDFMTTQIMPETPIQAVNLLFIGIVILGVRYGLGTVTRTAEIFFPWIIGFILFLSITLIPEIKQERMQPVFENGIGPILQGTFHYLGLPFLELVVFLMIIPAIQHSKKTGKAFCMGTLIGGFIILLMTGLSIWVLGPTLASNQMYPSYALAMKINIGDFLQRVEAFMAGIWFMTIYFKLTICFYASSLGLAQTFKLNGYRLLILPFGMVLMAMTQIISPNIVYFNNIINEVWTPFSMTFGLFFPLLLLVVAIIRKQKLG